MMFRYFQMGSNLISSLKGNKNMWSHGNNETAELGRVVVCAFRKANGKDIVVKTRGLTGLMMMMTMTMTMTMMMMMMMMA